MVDGQKPASETDFPFQMVWLICCRSIAALIARRTPTSSSGGLLLFNGIEMKPYSGVRVAVTERGVCASRLGGTS